MSRWRLSGGRMILLCLNAIALGACLTLLALFGPTGPLILLTVGTFLMLVSLVGQASPWCQKKDGDESIGR